MGAVGFLTELALVPDGVFFAEGKELAGLTVAKKLRGFSGRAGSGGEGFEGVAV